MSRYCWLAAWSRQEFPSSRAPPVVSGTCTWTSCPIAAGNCRRWIGRWEGNDCGPFSVVRLEDGRWLGRVGVLVWDVRTWTHTTFADAGEFAQPELGWALASEYWGQGYATEAAVAAREWAYAERGFQRLISLIEPSNVRSQRVARRLGATPGETIELFDNGPHVVWAHPRPVPGTGTEVSPP